jgi:hypothetical protein
MMKLEMFSRAAASQTFSLQTSSAVLPAIAAVVASGCVGETPPSDIATPDILKISVFYPVDGLVRGRGLPGAISDRNATHVRVASHPTKGETIVPVGMDGSFDFSIIAISDDLIEIAAALDDSASERGNSVYIVVPPTPLPAPTFVCCGATETRMGTCQTLEEREMGAACRDAATGISMCNVDRDCGVEGGERLPLDESKIQITPPDVEGTITIAGTVQPSALVTIENRGQSGVGGYRPTQRRLVTITDEFGTFSFLNVAARGDDELVIQVHDLLGFRSPEASMLVPDSPLVGVDVIGVRAFESLQEEVPGPVAFLFSPYGMDGRGICPDSNDSPDICLSGGLTYDMVQLEVVTQVNDNGDVQAMIETSRTATRADIPYTRGLIGEDPLGGPQDIYVVIDKSMDSNDEDPNGDRFDYIASFVSGLRARDYVGLATYGGFVKLEVGLVQQAQRQAIRDRILALKNEDPRGTAVMFGGIAAAADELRAARTRRPGRIVVFTMTDEEGDLTEATAAFDIAFDLVRPNVNLGFDGITVDIVGVKIRLDGNIALMTDMTAFTGGTFYNLLGDGAFARDEGAYGPTLSELRTEMSGSFALLFDVTVPAGAGKVLDSLAFQARIALPGADPVRVTYVQRLKLDP